MGKKKKTINGNAKLLKPTEVCEILSISIDTLSRWRSSGIGPVFCKFHEGRQAIVRYRECDVEAFIDGSVRRTTEGYGPTADGRYKARNPTGSKVKSSK
jgi:hypothetical protein